MNYWYWWQSFCPELWSPCSFFGSQTFPWASQIYEALGSVLSPVDKGAWWPCWWRRRRPGDCFACPGSRAELSKLKPAGALCSPALSQGGPSRRTQDLPLHCCASNVLAWICTLLAGDSSWGGAKEGHSHSHLIPSASMGERGTPGPHSE